MKYDVVIIGSGPAGLSMAICLADTKLKILLIDQLPLAEIEKPAYDGREIALTHASKKYLQQLNVWSMFAQDEVHRIAEANVFSGNSEHILEFDRLPENTNELGYIISNQAIREKLYACAKDKSSITILDSTNVTSVDVNGESNKIFTENNEPFEAELLIAADSRFSKMRNQMGMSATYKDFARTAIVFTAKHQDSHRNTATECFNYGHTLAILPLQDNESSIVITIDSDKSHAFQAMSEAELIEFVERGAEQFIGKITTISKRFYYPLVGALSKSFVNKRSAIIGDAAVGMHPVTAHGYNLGLQSAVILSQEIKQALSSNQDFASEKVLHNYQRKHKFNSKIMYEGTNLVVKLFTSDSGPHKVLRKAVLSLANKMSPLKAMITRKLTDA